MNNDSGNKSSVINQFITNLIGESESDELANTILR